MRRFWTYFALVLPPALLLFFTLAPQADLRFASPLFHFYIVSFTTFAATVVSLFVAISVGETALPRHLLLALAFAWMGAVFFVHGLTTTGALIEHFHPGLVWGAWMTLFGGGAIFLASGFAPNAPNPRLLRAAAWSVLGIYLLFALAAGFWPGLLNDLLALSISPTLAQLVFWITLAIWLASSARHYVNYRQTQNFVDGLMAFESAWYATATISLFRYPVWNFSWWLYHALLLAGFLLAIFALWRAYEQIRAFRLTPYYAATSLIVTAALALLAAQAYTQLVYRNLVAQLENSTALVTQNLAAQLAAGLPEAASAESLSRLSNTTPLAATAEQLMQAEGLAGITLHAADGLTVFSTIPAQRGTSLKGTEEFNEVEEALAGKTAFALYAPGEAETDYAPSSSVHVLATYVPFRRGGDRTAAPIGMLTTFREAPELGASLILSRRAGVAVAALSLGGLFVALLAIVRRADQLIRTRAAELERAYTDLRQAQAVRDDLTNMIVHDLRNPLTAIVANIDLIGRTIDNPTFAEASPRFVSSARLAGQRMTGMIDDLLNVSKFEAGELQPFFAPVYFPTLLAEKEPAYRAQAEQESKHFSIHAPADLPTVQADASLMARVIDNLVSNAFKYTDADGHVEIRVERRGSQLSLRVKDDGEGIPPEYQGRIFEKFVQVKNAMGAPLRKGTGLGLAFCRLAVEAHRGTIRVESLPGQGSEFIVTLPINE